MRSSNPVMRGLDGDLETERSSGAYESGFRNQFDSYANEGQQEGAPAREEESRPMTVDDVVMKTGITLAIIVIAAIANFAVALMGYPQISQMLTLVGAIGGFIAVLVHSFGKKFGSAPVTITYAVFEGLFVGGISITMSQWVIGNTNAGALVGQAVLGTIGVFLGMLFVYKSGAVRVTPKFQRIITGCIIGVAVLSLGNLVLFWLTGANPLRGGGALAIIFSLVCIVLGALSFLQDFDLADHLVRSQAPNQMAWGVALGLAVTLIWLYTEILRLFSYANRD